jgi:hypothetical protein
MTLATTFVTPPLLRWSLAGQPITPDATPVPTSTPEYVVDTSR